MATSICYSTECEKIIKIYRHKPKHNYITEYQVKINSKVLKSFFFLNICINKLALLAFLQRVRHSVLRGPDRLGVRISSHARHHLPRPEAGKHPYRPHRISQGTSYFFFFSCWFSILCLLRWAAKNFCTGVPKSLKTTLNCILYFQRHILWKSLWRRFSSQLRCR